MMEHMNCYVKQRNCWNLHLFLLLVEAIFDGANCVRCYFYEGAEPGPYPGSDCLFGVHGFRWNFYDPHFYIAIMCTCGAIKG